MILDKFQDTLSAILIGNNLCNIGSDSLATLLTVELVGDIWDEEEVARESFRKLEDGSFEADAELDMEELFELLDYEEGEDEDWNHKLLGEWVYENFDTMPVVGKSFLWKRLEVTVAEMRGRRLLKLKLRLLPETEGGAEA